MRTLVAKVPEGINIEDTGGWEEIDMAIDSGATETVKGTIAMMTANCKVDDDDSGEDVKNEAGEKQVVPDWFVNFA